MIKAISKRDFKKYGCVTCGCDSVKLDNQWSMESKFVVCPECGAEFMILANGLKQSNICRASNVLNENGEKFNEYPLLIEHPRKGIKKHPYKPVDLRPYVEGEEYFICKSFYFDTAVFQVSCLDAAKRIEQMFKNCSYCPYKCTINYDRKNPFYITMDVSCRDINRITYLTKMIKDNRNVISNSIITNASLLQENFANNWHYGYKSLNVISLVNQKYLNNVLCSNGIIDCSDDSKNILLMCEALGVNSLINNCLANKNDILAEKILLSFIHSLQNGYYQQSFDYSVFNQRLLNLAIERSTESLSKIPYVEDESKNKIDYNISGIITKESSDNLINKLAGFINFQEVTDANINIYKYQNNSSEIVNYLLTGLYYQIKKDQANDNYKDMSNAIGHTYYALKNIYKSYYTKTYDIDSLIHELEKYMPAFRLENSKSYSIKKGV